MPSFETVAICFFPMNWACRDCSLSACGLLTCQPVVAVQPAFNRALTDSAASAASGGAAVRR